MATRKSTTKKKSAPRKRAPAKKPPAKKAKSKKAPARSTPAKETKAAPKKRNGKMSALDAAAKVLAGTKQALTCTEMIEAMAAKKLWTSPGGKTPDRTLYSAILREINTKAKGARFKKTERGKFAAKE